MEGKLLLLEKEHCEYVFKKVLITGGCGFIASNLVNYLVENYPNVTFVNIDCLYYCSSENNITISEKPNYTFVKGSITDQSLVYNLLIENEIDSVLHFAAKV